MVLVDAAEDDLGPLAAVVVGVAQVEGEDGLVDQLLVDHVVEGRHDPVDRDGVVAQAQDAVEAPEGEGQAGLVGRLGEVLPLDREVADGHFVVGHEAAQAAGAVLDLEGAAVFLVRRRRRRVIRRVQVAGDGAALLGRHPQVRAAGVEDDLEVLGRIADGDLREVLPVDHVSAAVTGQRIRILGHGH